MTSPLVQHASESVEWYSPRMLVNPCRSAMGSIDLDPASCPTANKVVQAAHIYTRDDDGVSKPWWGNVFLNSPYGTTTERPWWSQAELSFGRYSLKEIWLEKFLREFRTGRVVQACIVITASTGDGWFHRLVVPTATAMCFPRRIPFRRPGETKQQNGQPGSSVVLYYGPYGWRFLLELSVLGWVVMDWCGRISA